MPDALPSSRIDEILNDIARRQLGLVTIGQARAAGVSSSAFHRRSRSGLWLPVHTGVYRTSAMPRTIEQRLLAGALAQPGSVLVGPSAGIVDGLPVGPAGAVSPVVAVTADRSARTRGVSVVRLSVDLPTRPWHGVRITTPAATVVTLTRFVSPDRLERCLDHCLTHRLTTVQRVASLLESLPARTVPSRRTLLRLLAARAEHGIGHRSWNEQDVGSWLDAAGLGGWQANARIPVAVGDPIECDLVWWSPTVILEVSPFHTHGSKAAQERDAERRGLLVAAGWRIIEATDDDLEDESSFQRVVSLLRALMPPSRS